MAGLCQILASQREADFVKAAAIHTLPSAPSPLPNLGGAVFYYHISHNIATTGHSSHDLQPCPTCTWS
jgi:hypothetical protein